MKSFEERLQRLEEISRNINEECPLEEAVGLFEEGIKISRGLEKELGKIERKVEILVNTPPVEETRGAGSSEREKPALDLFPDLDE
ncbi:MAG: exodeoxyribonuclease VII small subunit [Spirochaetales bacterium]|nr:exodeoxyribonuclease VII small subunit [Spirochaetales bacterium]